MIEISVLDILEFSGTYAFAISGIRLAASKSFDWFGAFVIGMVTAIGGGTIRDLMLGVNPFWMDDPVYLIESFIAFLTVLLFSKKLVRHDYSLFIFDTIGLAFFTVVGVEKTLDAGFPLWTATIMGSITGAAGGIIRDVLINEIPLVFRKEIYAMACILGGIVFGLCQYLNLPLIAVELISGFSVFELRYLAVAKHLSLPHLTELEQNDTENKD